MVHPQVIRITTSSRCCCQSSPRTRASNWAWESVSEPFPAAQRERPWMSRRQASQIPLALPDQHLQPRSEPVGGVLSVMRARFAEDLHHMRQDTLHSTVTTGASLQRSSHTGWLERCSRSSTNRPPQVALRPMHWSDSPSSAASACSWLALIPFVRVTRTTDAP
jgi:hypothetical protein